jgi:RNA polymerase sigma factor (sigma-70 family)
MLNELSKRDKEWRLLARQITTTSNLPTYLADDFVNDMYIKLHDKKGKYNTSYIYLTLKSICYDYLRKRKDTVPFEKIFPPEYKYYNESDDDERYVKELAGQINTDALKEAFGIIDEYCNSIDEIKKQLYRVPYNHRTVCLLKQDLTFRELSKQTDIKLSRIYTWYKKGIDDLSKNPQLKELYYEITRTG